MVFYTSIHIHTKVITFWNRIGIAPLHIVSITKSKSETLEPVKDKFKPNSTQKINSQLTYPHTISIYEDFNNSSSVHKLHCEEAPQIENDNKEETADGFPVYNFESYKTTGVMFWIMLCFFYGSAIFSVYALCKMIVQIGEFPEGKSFVNVDFKTSKNNATINYEFPVLMGGFVWTIYSFTCCSAYFVHFFKTDFICLFLKQWQIVEGELISESKAMKYSGGTFENYIKGQKKGMIGFLLGVPISFVFMGMAANYSDKFPMNIYFYISPEWEEGRPWILPLCYIFMLIQALFFLLSESQTELLAISFSRSILKCLRILSRPATNFSQHHAIKGIVRFRHLTDNSKNCDNCVELDETEMSSIFDDSVERFRKLRDLVENFNFIFSGPVFIKQAFTLMKVCCYVYLFLKHPFNAGYPAGLVFSYAAFAISAKFGLILGTMGAVKMESERFVKEWTMVLLALYPKKKNVEEERKLKTCVPFGFCFGNFYMITSQTVLTFFSVVLTYLIIFLQLRL